MADEDLLLNISSPDARVHSSDLLPAANAPLPFFLENPFQGYAFLSVSLSNSGEVVYWAPIEFPEGELSSCDFFFPIYPLRF